MPHRKTTNFIKNLSDKLKATKILRNSYNFIEDLLSKNVIKNNIVLKDIGLGKRCFIIGTGVSLEFINLTTLSNEITFGCNYIFHQQKFNELNLNYYFEVDQWSNLIYLNSKSKFINKTILSKDQVLPYYDNESHIFPSSVLPEIYFNDIDASLGVETKVFLNAVNKKYIDKQKMFPQKTVYYIKGSHRILDTTEQVSDLTKRITFSDGSILMMLATAFYMGFNEIYLIGADYSLKPSLVFHFYDSPVISKKLLREDALKLIREIANARAVEVFSILEDDNYYKPLFVNPQMGYEKHCIVKKFADSNHVKIFSVTPTGFESPVYDKISWDEVLLKLNKEKA